MFKTQLQELCQRMHWKLPEYRAEREGLDHNPRFSATVTVNGVPFRNATPSRSSKEAQNDAARIAFEHLARPDSTLNPNADPFNATTHVISRSQMAPQMSPPTKANGFSSVPKNDIGISVKDRESSFALLQKTNELSSGPLTIQAFTSASSGQGCVFATRGSPQPRVQPIRPVQQIDGNASCEKNGTLGGGLQYLYKNQLQIYVQKRNLMLPLYSHERKGPPHASMFRCKVTVDGKTYESLEFFPTLKEAENAAAKVALMSLFPDGLQEDDRPLYKNLLQELAQKEGFSVPSYCTVVYGEAHIPSFISTVRIEGQLFKGDQAKSKKQAEMNAAKVAYCTLKKRKSGKHLKILSAVQQGLGACELSSHFQISDITTAPQQILKGKSPATSNPIVTSSEQAEQIIEKAEVSSQHSSILSPKPHTTRNAGLSSDDIVNAQWQESISIPSASCSKDGSSSSSSLSECLDRLSIAHTSKPSAETYTHSREVIVMPRTANTATPEDWTVLPISDDNWVAMERESN